MPDLWPDMENDPDAQRRIKKSIELLDCKDGMTVLDVGCHKQEARQYLPEKSLYCGIDSVKLNPDTQVIDLDGNFDFPHQVDRILCLEVLEHLLMPSGTLQTLHRLLKDDGILVVSLPNEASMFHRLRCLMGIVDQEAFSFPGKHLHLPSLHQARKFVNQFFLIEDEAFYLSHKPKGTRQKLIPLILSLIPIPLLQLLANVLPSLFARGFIFKLRKKL